MVCHALYPWYQARVVDLSSDMRLTWLAWNGAIDSEPSALLSHSERTTDHTASDCIAPLRYRSRLILEVTL
jgi:hypothetical protein